MDHKLLHVTGRFMGHGINHAAERFVGTMTLMPVLGNCGTVLTFTAMGDSDMIFHDERTLIGLDAQGRLSMVSTSNNTGALLHYALQDAEGGRLVFRLGDLDDEHSFRETRELVLHEDGDVTYRFSWGQPGGPFRERSVVRMADSRNHL
ncbi:hypothetical protein [Sulfobacillus harzensis]|uniref:Uncharacterized protein n=1 Tax=Sulfobacillus harzensis TaxID=2729629 RepID=A0A7Y0L7X9_9FIRM|nr:hypothetical protein [Sulfobacillus harzensis]NMP24637.1 hypothetical protein [Sulfobacillus harzensis]